jgi:hypothetical protein
MKDIIEAIVGAIFIFAMGVGAYRTSQFLKTEVVAAVQKGLPPLEPFNNCLNGRTGSND